MLTDHPGGKGASDAVDRKNTAIRVYRLRSSLECAVSERDIGRDHHITGPRVLCNPIIGRVRSLLDHHRGDPGLWRHADPTIRNDEHRELITLRHPIQLVIDRTSIRIDVEGGHGDP